MAAQPAVGLGTATSYAVLAGTTVTNTGPSVIGGDLGVSPGTAVTGFPPGLVNAGTIHSADAVALQAQDDLTTAYNDAAGRGPVVDQTNKDLGGQTLVSGVYRAANAMALTGRVTLDAQGDPGAVFVFQAGSTLITASSSTVALVGGAQACNVFWQVGSSATIGTSTTFVGSVLALSDISLQTRATVAGRMLARNGQVTLDTNTITRPLCTASSLGTTGTTPSAAPTTSPSAAASSAPITSPTGGTKPKPKPKPERTDGPSSKPMSSTPSATPGSTPTTATFDDDGGEGGGSTTTGTNTSGTSSDTPVPTGHPDTGRPVAPGHPGWLALGLACLGGASLVGFRGLRRRGGTHRLA